MHKKTKGLLRDSYSPGLSIRFLFLLLLAGLFSHAQTPQTITSRPEYAGNVTAAYFIADVPGGVTRKVSGGTILNTLRLDTNSFLATRSWVLQNAGSAGSGGAQVNSDWNAVSGVSQILNKPSTFTPPIASPSVLGGIKLGTGWTIDGSGVASVTGAGNVYTLNNTQTDIVVYSGSNTLPLRQNANKVNAVSVYDTLTGQTTQVPRALFSFTPGTNQVTFVQGSGAALQSGDKIWIDYDIGAAYGTLDSTAIAGFHTTRYYDLQYYPLASGNTNATNITTLQGYFNTGILKNTSFPALTGDVTTSAGSLVTALAASGVSAGTYGDATHVPVITVDAKGRATTVTTALISAGLTNPMTTQYDLIVGGASGTPTRQALGSNGQYLGVRGGVLGYYAIQASDVPNITESQVTSLTADLAAKQASLTLTTTGTSGAATLVGSTLNIPQYSGGGGSNFPTQQVDATTGATVTVTNQTGNIWLIKNPSTVVSSYTITFPPTPVDGQSLAISFGGSITSGAVVSNLSLAGNGSAILQSTSPTSVSAGETIMYRYSAAISAWERL